MKIKWSHKHVFGLGASILGVGFAGWLLPLARIQLMWIVFIIGIALFVMVAAHGMTGRFWFGWAINEQYRMSLSRVQMFLWTSTVLASFLVSVIANIRSGHLETAVAVGIPEELWLAMGISTSSLVASPLIVSRNKKKQTNESDAEKTVLSLGLYTEETLTVDRQNAIVGHFEGQVFRNSSPGAANLSDLFRGEATGNASILDFTRVQNLVFTLVLVVAYAANINSVLVSSIETIASEQIMSLPGIDNAFVVLLGISHAGYLVAKETQGGTRKKD